MPYLRDLGGWKASDGQVRRGLLFRSALLAAPRDADADALAFAKLGLRSVFDLRTVHERAERPDQVPAGVEYMGLDVLGDIPTEGPGQLFRALMDPRAADQIFGNKSALFARFEQGYRYLVSLPSALAAYHKLYAAIAEPEHRPALVHCSTGKDRTGWAAAALLLLLGVDEDDVYADYLRTSRQLSPAQQPVVDQFVAAGGDASLLTPFLGVQMEYIDIAVDEMREQFGSIERYFAKGLQLDEHTIKRLRTVYVE